MAFPFCPQAAAAAHSGEAAAFECKPACFGGFHLFAAALLPFEARRELALLAANSTVAFFSASEAEREPPPTTSGSPVAAACAPPPMRRRHGGTAATTTFPPSFSKPTNEIVKLCHVQSLSCFLAVLLAVVLLLLPAALARALLSSIV